MENKKIKVLKDTPFDKKDTLLTVEEFFKKYNYIYNPTLSSDIHLFTYLEQEYKFEQETPRYGIGSWFQVVEDNSFKVGDWVWSELLNQALYVVETDEEKKYPNMCTMSAVKHYSDTYKRKATKEEIDFYSLESFCDGRVLIGKYKCYYFNFVWEQLTGISSNITTYLNGSKQFTKINQLDLYEKIENNWDCKLNGLKVGCTEISHEDILKIAKILKLI